MDSSYQQNNPFGDDNNQSKNNNDDKSKKNHSKKGKGRQKIPMEKIKSETNLQVTFSKRRVGLFKKANELHTLCGGENAIVVYSPSGKAHSFAAPNIETITDQFLSGTRFNQMPSTHDNPIISQRNAELTNLERQLEDEKRKKKEHCRTRKVKMNEIDYPPNIDLLDFNQLQALQDNLLDLKNALTTVKGAIPDVGGGRPRVGYPMDPNIQVPPIYNNMASQFYYGNNGTMLNDNGQFVPDDGLINYQTTFDFSVNNNNNNPNVWHMNDANHNNQNGAAFLPDMVTNNHVHFDQMVNNNNSTNQLPPRPNDHEAGGSSSLMFLNNEEVSNQDGKGGEDGEARGRGENGYDHDMYGGFNNYNNFGYGN